MSTAVTPSSCSADGASRASMNVCMRTMLATPCRFSILVAQSSLALQNSEASAHAALLATSADSSREALPCSGIHSVSCMGLSDSSAASIPRARLVENASAKEQRKSKAAKSGSDDDVDAD
jgi:hypothetical protein